MYYEKRRKRWRVVWQRDGQRATRSFETEREAKAFEAKLELGIADTTPSSLAALTFNDLAERWVRLYCKVEKSETQWACDEMQIKLHLSPSLGPLPVKGLKRLHLMAVKAEMREKVAHGKRHKLSPRTINAALGLAKTIMGWAVQQEIIGRNPFSDVKPLKQAARDYQWWNLGELRDYLERGAEYGVDPEMLRLVEVAAHTGLRAGELAGLRREHLDFQRKKIRVAQSYSLKIGKTLPTKNKGVEDVPMNSAVVRALEPKRFLKPTDAVFDLGLFRDLCWRFKQSAKVADVKPVRFHDLRHSYASNLAAAGVDVQTIQKLMRHKSLAMTQRYMHLSPDHLKGSTEVLCTQPARGESEESKSGAAKRI